jgi:hypothetical protein
MFSGPVRNQGRFMGRSFRVQKQNDPLVAFGQQKSPRNKPLRNPRNKQWFYGYDKIFVLFFREIFPYFLTAPSGWQSGIKSALEFSPFFLKIEIPKPDRLSVQEKVGQLTRIMLRQ